MDSLAEDAVAATEDPPVRTRAPAPVAETPAPAVDTETQALVTETPAPAVDGAMSLRLKLFIAFVALAALGAVGLVLYLEIFSPVITALVLPAAKTVYHPGDKMVINYKGHYIDRFALSVSSDGGQTWFLQEQNLKLPYTWTVPSGIYSRKVQLRLADMKASTKRFKTSSTIAVLPQLKITSDVMLPGAQVAVPGVVSLQFSTDSTLVTSDNLRLWTSLDGVTWTPTVTPITVDLKQNRVIWQTEATLAGTAQFLRLATIDLLNQGFADELSAETSQAVTFKSAVGPVAQSQGSSLLNLAFERLKITDVNNVEGSFTVGRTLILQYLIKTGVVDLTHFVWEWSPTNASTWTRFYPVVGLNSNNFTWSAPRTVMGPITVRLTQDQASVQTDITLMALLNVLGLERETSGVCRVIAETTLSSAQGDTIWKLNNQLSAGPVQQAGGTSLVVALVFEGVAAAATYTLSATTRDNQTITAVYK